MTNISVFIGQSEGCVHGGEVLPEPPRDRGGRGGGQGNGRNGGVCLK